MFACSRAGDFAEHGIALQAYPDKFAPKADTTVDDACSANRTNNVRRVHKSLATSALYQHDRHQLLVADLVRRASFQKVNHDGVLALFGPRFFGAGAFWFSVSLRRRGGASG